MKTQSQELSKNFFYASWISSPLSAWKICFFHFMLSYFLIRNNVRRKHNKPTQKNEMLNEALCFMDGMKIIFILWLLLYFPSQYPLLSRRVLIDDGYGQRIELRKQNVCVLSKKKPYSFRCYFYTHLSKNNNISLHMLY